MTWDYHDDVINDAAKNISTRQKKELISTHQHGLQFELLQLGLHPQQVSLCLCQARLQAKFQPSPEV